MYAYVLSKSMSCSSRNAINGGGSTQPFGRNGVVTAAAGRGAAGNFAAIKMLQPERYKYKDGDALWPQASRSSLPRQASNYWSYKPRNMMCDVSAGFVGCRNPETNRIVPVFAGLPNCPTAPVPRDPAVTNQFRRRAAAIANRPRAANGKQPIGRSQCTFAVFWPPRLPRNAF